jgi:hypothetical protein
MVLTLASSSETFSAAHIALTAAITGVLAFAAAVWRLSRSSWPDIVAVAVLSAASVFLWRISANMPQLNNDGLPGFSANDWAAPVLTYVFLGLYSDARSPAETRHYAQSRALATVVSLVVNVITI